MQKEQQNAGFVAFYWIKSRKTWMIMAATKFEILLALKQMKKFGFSRVTHSDTAQHFIVRNARQNSLVTEQCSI